MGPNMTIANEITDLDLYDATPSQLAINCQVEQLPVPKTVLMVKSKFLPSSPIGRRPSKG
jgi:hypothetical protein